MKILGFINKKSHQEVLPENESHLTKSRLVIVIGVAGSGKTEIGKSLANRLHYIYIDKDTVSRGFTDALLSLNGLHQGDRESDIYLEKIRPLEYEVLLDVAEENIRLGNHVIISSPFLKEAQQEDWLERELHRLTNYVDLKVIWVKSDRATERKRIIDRCAVRDEWKLKHWTEYANKVDKFDVLWKKKNDIFEFNNSEDMDISFDKQIEEAVKWIQK